MLFTGHEQSKVQSQKSKVGEGNRGGAEGAERLRAKSRESESEEPEEGNRGGAEGGGRRGMGNGEWGMMW